MKITLSKSQWEEVGKKAGWIRTSQVQVESKIEVDAGTMRRTKTTMGTTSMDLDALCDVLNRYQGDIRTVEEIRKTLNAIADGGITLLIDRQGFVSAQVNAPRKNLSEYNFEGDYAGTK